MKHKKILVGILGAVGLAGSLILSLTITQASKITWSTYNSNKSTPFGEKKSYWIDWRHVVLTHKIKFTREITPYYDKNNPPKHVFIHLTLKPGNDIWVKYTTKENEPLDWLTNYWLVKGKQFKTEVPQEYWFIEDSNKAIKANPMNTSYIVPYTKTNKKWFSTRYDFRNVQLTQNIKITEFYDNEDKKRTIKHGTLRKGTIVAVRSGDSTRPWWMIKKKGWGYKGWNMAKGYYTRVDNKSMTNTNWFKTID